MTGATGVRHETGTFDAADGRRLFERSWRPDTAPRAAPRAAVILVHGYAEHSGRYVHVGEALAGVGYAVYALDLRGHGRSEGEQAQVASFGEYLRDLRRYVQIVRERERSVPLFLFGHSMGGTIVALEMAVAAPSVRGVLLSGAGLRAGAPGLVRRVILVLGRLLPGLPLIRLDAATVSRDEQVVRLYDEDPLVYRGRIKAGILAAMTRALQRIERDMEQIRAPLLIMHGADDALTSPEGSEELHRRASSDDKTLKLYDGLFHEILNEPERDLVLKDMIAWLDARS